MLAGVIQFAANGGGISGAYIAIGAAFVALGVKKRREEGGESQ